MRILMVNKFLFPNGGSETYIFELGKELIRMGHQVEYFGMRDDRNIVGNSADCYTENLDFHKKNPASLFYPFRIIYSVEARRRIKAVIEKFEPDIVHINNFNFQLTPSIIFEIKKHHLPIVYTAHDYQLICPNHICMDVINNSVCESCVEKGFGQCLKKRCIHGSWIKSFIGMIEALLYKMLRTYRFLDVVICPSDFLRTKLDTYRELKGRTLTLHNFLASYPQCGNVMPDTAEKYILYFGRYESEKGVLTLIDACRRLPEVNFKFAGRGSLESHINQLPNAENCGFIESEALQHLIRNAVCTICPSEWYENCPFSVMESIDLGVPVIGAKIGGISELIRENENGLLYQSGNIEELVERIHDLWKDDTLCRELAVGCQKKIFDTCGEYCDKLINIYKGAINSNMMKEKE